MRIRKPTPIRQIIFDYAVDMDLYFVTILSKDRFNLFGEIKNEEMSLSELVEIVKNEIVNLSGIYKDIFVNHHVVMPNHLHNILTINKGELCSPDTPTISRIIKQFKGAVSKKMGFSPWHKSFHSHTICSEESYNKIANYIKCNVSNWKDDCFFHIK